MVLTQLTFILYKFLFISSIIEFDYFPISNFKSSFENSKSITGDVSSFGLEEEIKGVSCLDEDIILVATWNNTWLVKIDNEYYVCLLYSSF